VDLDRRITYWNKAAEKITGRAAAEVMGFNCANNIMDDIDSKAPNCVRQNALSPRR